MADRMAAYLQVTRKCNNECIFCSNPQFDQESTLDALKAEVLSFHDQGITEIFLTGGEPTIAPYILDLVAFIRSKGMNPRMISNGVELSDMEKARSLKDAGLEDINVSIHHFDATVADGLAQRSGHFSRTVEGIRNAIDEGLDVTLNSAINAKNAGVLSKLAMFLVGKFPEVKHFVFNNLDPGDADGVHKSRAGEHPEIVPRFIDLELELLKALSILSKNGKTFRVERVPLCYMRGFEEFSTETRKIVKDEKYTCAFLRSDSGHDIRTVSPDVRRVKTDVCRQCSVDAICAGVQKEYAAIHGMEELNASFEDPEAIRERIGVPHTDGFENDEFPEKVRYKDINPKLVYDLWKAHSKDDHPAFIYVHIPYCPSKCEFCSCGSEVPESKDVLDGYLAALEKEMSILSKATEGKMFKGLYIGGGTPTIFSGERLKALLNMVNSHFKLADGAEITIEATPGTLDTEKVDVIADCGITRVSIGIQSLDPETLKNIGRCQDYEGISKIAAAIKQKRVLLDIDMVIGLEGETRESFRNGLKRVIDLSPDSMQICTFKPRASTMFARKGKRIQDMALLDMMRHDAHSLMKESGFHRLDFNHDIYYRNAGAICRYESMQTLECASVVGIGAEAKSHIFSALIYENKNKSAYEVGDSVPVSRGVRIDVVDEMAMFVLNNMGRQIPDERFKRIFGIGIHDVLDRQAIDGKGEIILGKKELISHFRNMPPEYPDLLKMLGSSEGQLRRKLSLMLSQAGKQVDRFEYPPENVFTVIPQAEAIKASSRLKDDAPEGHRMGLYVHIPFCRSKCVFCNCDSGPPIDVDRYMDSLEEEMRRFACLPKIDTIYIGGGSPTLIDEKHFVRMMDALRVNFKIDDAWINIESPPWDIDDRTAAMLERFKVDRVSIGVQSLNKGVLDDMNRRQTYYDIENAIKALKSHGIPAVNVDFIAGLPGETLETFRKGVKSILKLEPEGVHFYLFLPSHSTLFSRMGRKLTKEEFAASHEMLKSIRADMLGAGYREVAKNIYLREGLDMTHTNVHSINEYEHPNSVIGFGAHASSHIYGRMFYDSPDIKEYMDDADALEMKGIRITGRDEMARYVIEHLSSGIDKGRFRKVFGNDIDIVFKEEIGVLESQGKISDKDKITSRMKGDEQRIFEKIFYSMEILENEGS